MGDGRVTGEGPTTLRRRRARHRGRLAEAAARAVLRLKGFRIIGRNVRTPVGELDIVARRGDLVVFAEVKARRDWETAAYALQAPQIRRLTRAAEAFLGRRPELARLRVRFDMFLVRPWRWPRHLVDAWRPDP